MEKEFLKMAKLTCAYTIYITDDIPDGIDDSDEMIGHASKLTAEDIESAEIVWMQHIDKNGKETEWSF